LDDFEALVQEIDVHALESFKTIQKAFALVRERRFRALVRQNGLRSHCSAHYYAVAKCHFEGTEFKKKLILTFLSFRKKVPEPKFDTTSRKQFELEFIFLCKSLRLVCFT
jgi:hypothetical protein